MRTIYLIFVDRLFDAVPSDARTAAYISLALLWAESGYLGLRGVGLYSLGKKLSRSLRQRRSTGPLFRSAWGAWRASDGITLTCSYPRALILLFLMTIGVGGLTWIPSAVVSAESALATIPLSTSLTLDINSTSLDVFAPALPLILLITALSINLGGISAYLAGSYSRITAEESGIAVANRHRKYQISWDDSMFFVRVTRSAYPAVAGSYALPGRRTYVVFDISGSGEAPPANISNRSRTRRSGHQFEGGYQQYAKDARRLIELIQHRTGLESHDISSELLSPEQRAFLALESLNRFCQRLTGETCQVLLNLSYIQKGRAVCRTY